MSRTIDLEGIGTDGFGYTVTISGPIGPETPNNTGFFHTRFCRRRRHQTNVSAEPNGPGVSVATHTEVSVKRDLPLELSKRDSRVNSMSPIDLDDVTFESMGLHMNGLLEEEDPSLSRRSDRQQRFSRRGGSQDVENYFEGNNSTVEALPQMPSASRRDPRQSRNDGSVRDISWFGDLPSPRDSR
jgi:hypothetical protein